ncbi:MAG: hypothetical protein LBQ12_04010 [Deltaproteobacteria bacterium]|nr:hypothetical protein [Deltaproteobacteria bacterium]
MDLEIYPFRLLLTILHGLYKINSDDGFITAKELCDVVMPLSGKHAEISDYTKLISKYRNNNINNCKEWPNCIPECNDKRMANEFIVVFELVWIQQKSDYENARDLIRHYY